MKTAAMPRPFGALMICTMATAALALFAAHVSGAATTPTVTCPGTSSTAFAQWGDQDQYTLAPNGDFEAANFATASGWTLAGGAAQVAGNESFGVHAKTDSHSLSLPAGATATTPSICVNVYDPTIRLFATGASGSSLAVAVIATLSTARSSPCPSASSHPERPGRRRPRSTSSRTCSRCGRPTERRTSSSGSLPPATASRSTIFTSTRARGTDPRPSPGWRWRSLRPRRLHLAGFD